MPAAIAIPLIASAVSTGVGAYSSYKSRQQQQPLLNAETGVAQQQADQGKQLFNFGMPNLQKASNYYGSLLNGNRAAVTQTLAPTAAAITDTYKGAERNLTRLPPGATRDEASADLNRQRAGQVGLLPIAARQGAAAEVANLGGAATGQGVNATASAGGLYGNLVGQQFNQQKYTDQQQYQLGTNLSSIIGDFITSYRNRNTGGGSATGSTGGNMGSAGGY